MICKTYISITTIAFINKNMLLLFFQMSRVYTAQDALEIILNRGESDFESSDDEEITELAIDEEEVPEHNIDDYFSSSDD